MAVMHSQIFFDFRAVYGDAGLAATLRSHLNKLMQGRMDIYVRILAGHLLRDRPPIGFFRNFIVAGKGNHKHKLDLKKTMNFAVDFARFYALEHGISETNTIARMTALQDLGVVDAAELEELKQGYNYMMGLRLHHQLDNLERAEAEPGNYIDPYKLNDLDQEILKAVFKLLGRLQRKLRVRFGEP